MDLAKTIIPRICDKVKTLMGSVQPLPLKVIGILNHGHEPGVVAHVTIGGLWKSDPNFTITSIAKQLRDYESYHTDKKLGDLGFNTQTSHSLFNALLDEEVFNTTVLAKKHQSKEEYFQIDGDDNTQVRPSSSMRMLPPYLYIQLDNSEKDNKNWAMMTFCSELVARGCCKTITVSFLVVGHIHEDVDAFFSKVNAAQGGKDIEFLPHFLAKVYHVNHRKHIPVEILGYIWNYILYKEEMQKKTDETSSAFQEDRALLQYWKNVETIFQTGWPSIEHQSLKNEFWPSTDHSTGYVLGGPSTALALVPSAEVEEKLLTRDEIFVGAASARKVANFVPMIDIANGLMLLIRPSDDFECQDCLWVGNATRAVCKDQGDANFNKVPIHWWRTKHALSKTSITDRYSHCIQRDVACEVDPTYSGSYWILADSCVYAWKSRAKANKVSLPKSVQEIALAVFDRMVQASEDAMVLVES
ncbi:hypothetical protein R1sor_016496 [Riccia sorocarpa]|uniref:DUF7869 domain-containing protein n=1 Tax=Riccia sorocarpa TaxID=122646 RepID=A0ABD3HHX9_9MARC